MTYKKHVLAVVILFLLQLVSAQSKLDSLQHIKEVTVTANRTEKEVIPVQSLSAPRLDVSTMYINNHYRQLIAFLREGRKNGRLPPATFLPIWFLPIKD